jgi:hypothetical protein
MERTLRRIAALGRLGRGSRSARHHDRCASAGASAPETGARAVGGGRGETDCQGAKPMQCYIALLHKEGERYRVELADFPGSVASAPSLRDAPAVALRMLAEIVQARRAAGLPVPRPAPPESISALAALSGAVPVMVPAPAPLAGRVSVSVDLPAGLVERVDRRARVHGVHRSEILEKAARLALWETGRVERALDAARSAKGAAE